MPNSAKPSMDPNKKDPNINLKDLIVQINEMDAVFTQFNNERSLIMDSRIKTKRFGDATALIDPNRHGDEYYNRVVGFTEKELHYLDDILNWYDNNKSTCIFSLAPTQQTDQVLDSLKLKGFNYNGYDCIFNALPGEKTTILPEHITIEQITENNLNDLYQFLEKIWSIKKEICQKNRDFYTRPDFLFYMAKINGQAAATGSIFIYKDLAWLSNDSTTDAFRGNGCQRFLIEHRLDIAAQHGCSQVITDTEFAVTSHRNMLRNGFQLAYMTAEFIKEVR